MAQRSRRHSLASCCCVVINSWAKREGTIVSSYSRYFAVCSPRNGLFRRVLAAAALFEPPQKSRVCFCSMPFRKASSAAGSSEGPTAPPVPWLPPAQVPTLYRTSYVIGSLRIIVRRYSSFVACGKPSKPL